MNPQAELQGFLKYRSALSDGKAILHYTRDEEDPTPEHAGTSSHSRTRRMMTAGRGRSIFPGLTHDLFFDGKSHYFIDGSVYHPGGRLVLMKYDEESGTYSSIE